MEYQQLQDEIKAAMKARDNHRRDILRQVHTELKVIEVNERREVTEADVDARLDEMLELVLSTHAAVEKAPRTFDAAAHHKLARRAAAVRGNTATETLVLRTGEGYKKQKSR